MNKEVCIIDNKAILNADLYLDLLKKEIANDKAIKYIEKETDGYDKDPIEGTWLYNLYKVLSILKGGNNE